MSTADGKVIGTTKVIDHGPAEKRWNLVLMGDGYTSKQFKTYEKDVQNFINVLKATPPFTELWPAINIYRVNVASTESGADNPSKKIKRKTFFDAAFGAAGLERLLDIEQKTALDVAAKQVPKFHQAMVIVNSSSYGGSGGEVAVFSTHVTASQIGIHEMGHSAFGLADEYPFWIGCGQEKDRDKYTGGEPEEPNITISTKISTLKWRLFVNSKTNLPTTKNKDCKKCDKQASPVANNVVGLFEGGGYFHCGIYRPEYNCYMKEKGYPFCAVCRSTIIHTLSPFKPVDIYMRDNLWDTGEEPLLIGGTSRSPDINHFRNRLSDPEKTLGSTAAKDKDDLFETVEKGQTNYIYIRLQNKGTEAGTASVDIYWTKPSTLPTPKTWNRIGTLSVGDIRPGQFRVAGPLKWRTVPSTGEYCFISVLGTPKDPKPNISTIKTLDRFHQLARESNNVCWKNFDVKDLIPGGELKVNFQVQGWPREWIKSDLIFDLTALPTRVQVELRILKRVVEKAKLVGMSISHDTKIYRYLKVKSGQKVRLQDMNLAPSDNISARLNFTVPENVMDGAYDIAAIQEVRGQEMGRIIRRLNVGEFPYIANKRSKEVHRANCPWIPSMSALNKLPFTDLDFALRHGYDGCHTCLIDYDHG